MSRLSQKRGARNEDLEATRIARKKAPYQQPPSDEEPLAPDERWLLSYADLMTLLFGFFVILYALSLDEEHKFDDLVRSLAIGPVHQNLKSGQTDNEGSEVTGEIGGELDGSAEEDMNAALEASSQEITELKDKLEQVSSALDSSEKDKESLTQTIENLEKQLRGKTEGGAAGQSLVQALEKKDRQIEDLQERLNQATSQLSSPQPETGELSNKSYMSVMIYWTTANHDLDLTVKTPRGHSYDFQQRKHEGVAGEFILDTRRGPGAEIWHVDEADSGIYELKINLYSQYGNTEPAVFEGHISTVKGVLRIDQVSLDTTKKTHHLRFKMNEDATLELMAP